MERLPELRTQVAKSPDVEAAMLEIEEQAHQGSAIFSEFLKALFMWKESPGERIQRKKGLRG